MFTEGLGFQPFDHNINDNRKLPSEYLVIVWSFAASAQDFHMREPFLASVPGLLHAPFKVFRVVGKWTKVKVSVTIMSVRKGVGCGEDENGRGRTLDIALREVCHC